MSESKDLTIATMFHPQRSLPEIIPLKNMDRQWNILKPLWRTSLMFRFCFSFVAQEKCFEDRCFL